MIVGCGVYDVIVCWFWWVPPYKLVWKVVSQRGRFFIYSSRMKILCFPKYRFGYPLRVESSPATLYCGSVRSYYGLWLPPSVPSLNRRFEHQFSNQSLTLFPSHVCWYIVLKCRQCYKHLTYRHTLHSNARKASMFFSRFFGAKEMNAVCIFPRKSKKRRRRTFSLRPFMAASRRVAPLLVLLLDVCSVQLWRMCNYYHFRKRLQCVWRVLCYVLGGPSRYEGGRLTDSRAPPLLTSEDIKV